MDKYFFKFAVTELIIALFLLNLERKRWRI